VADHKVALKATASGSCRAAVIAIAGVLKLTLREVHAATIRAGDAT
jgi:hypothetical protein